MTDLLKFPCEFTLKVVGNAGVDVESIAVPVLRTNKIDIERIKIASKQSKGGKYTSLTITMHVDSKEQLDQIYRDLSSNPQIAMVL